MGVSGALLHSYSLLVRDRAHSATGKHRVTNVPRGMFSGNSRLCLLRRSPLGTGSVFSGQVEKRGDKVLARCFSLGRAASIIHTAGNIAMEMSDDVASPMAGAIARLVLQGLSSGVVNVLDSADPFIMDLGAGLMGQVAHHGADRLQKYASTELQQSGGALGGHEQLVRLAAYCALVDTPLMHWWQDWLDAMIMPGDPHSPLAVAMKVMLDQGLMAPLATLLMLTTIKLLDGKVGDVPAYVKKKFMEKLLPDYSVWPVARIIQYAFIPQAQHPLFEGLVSVSSAAMQVARHRVNKQQHNAQATNGHHTHSHQEYAEHASVNSLNGHGHELSSPTKRRAYKQSPLGKGSTGNHGPSHVWEGFHAISPFELKAHLPLEALGSGSSNHDVHEQAMRNGSHQGQLQVAFS